MNDRTAIPGLAEAVAQETRRRVDSFTPAPSTVCGVTLEPLTPNKLAVLESINCPILGGVEFPEPEDIAVFLWFCSDEFTVNDRKRERFTRRIARIDYYEALTGIQNWLADQFEDAPPSSGRESVSYVSWIAALVDAIASEYGWSEEDILNIPFKRLTQYIRAIQLRNNPKAILFNAKSDKIKGDFLDSQNTN